MGSQIRLRRGTAGQVTRIPHTTNCPEVANPSQINSDGNFIDLSPPKSCDDLTVAGSDGLGDACDPDDDNDGLPDVDELAGVSCGGTATDPVLRDTDGDHALDGPECVLGTSPTNVNSEPTQAQCGVSTDVDGDSVLAFREYCYYGTDPNNTNSDGDGCTDAREVYSVNANQSVDIIDLQQVQSEQGSYTSPGPPVKVNFDVTKNGTIDVIDLQQVASAFGSCP